MAMTMEEIGMGLLSEVEETDLSEILNALQAPASTIDDISHPPAHTPRPSSLPIPEIHPLLKNTAKPSAPIIDLTATQPLSGRTTVLYHAIAHAVLPRSHASTTSAATADNDEVAATDQSRHRLRGGKGGTAVILDNDANFSVMHLVSVMRAFLTSTTPSSTPNRNKSTSKEVPNEAQTAEDDSEIERSIRHALRHIHVLRPTSLPSLIATIESLHAYLLPDFQGRAQHHSYDRPLSLLAIDNATAFYYTARADADSALYSAALQSQERSLPPSDKPVSGMDLANALQSFRKTFSHTPILLTSTSLPPEASKAGPRSAVNETNRTGLRSLLQPSYVWDRILSHRLVLERASVPKFRQEIGIAGAERDREARAEVVRRGRVVVRSLGRESRGKEVEMWLRDGAISFERMEDD